MTKESFLGFLIIVTVAAAAAWRGGYFVSSPAPEQIESDAAATKLLGRQPPSPAPVKELGDGVVASAAIPARPPVHSGPRPLGEHRFGGVPPNPYGWPAASTSSGSAPTEGDGAPFAAPAASILGKVGEAWRSGDDDSPTPFATLRSEDSAAPLSKWKWTGEDEPSALAAMTEVPPPSDPVVWSDRTDLRRLDGTSQDREPFSGEAFLAEVPARVERPFGSPWGRPDMAASTSHEPAARFATPPRPQAAEELPYPRTDRVLVAQSPELPPPPEKRLTHQAPASPNHGGLPNFVELPSRGDEAAPAPSRRAPRPVVVDLTDSEPADAEASEHDFAAATPRTSNAEGRLTVVGSPSFVDIAERIYGDASLATPLQQWLERGGRPAGPPTPGEVLPIPRFDALVQAPAQQGDD